MNTRLTILLLLLLSTHLHAQPPKLSLIGGAGAWRDWLKYYDAYANDYQHWQPQVGLGLGMDFPLSKGISFVPEAGLEWYPMSHEYSNSGTHRLIKSDLKMFFGRLSPGFVLNPVKALSLRLGVNGLISTFATGEYLLKRYTSAVGYRDSVLYDKHFNWIRNPVIWGPEMAIGFRFTETKSGQFGLRLSSFLGLNRVFRKDFDTDFNPRIFQSRLELTYTFPAKEKTYKEGASE